MMKLSAVCRTLSLTTVLAITPIFQFSPNGQPSAIVAAQANRPLAIFVDGGDDCCVSQMPDLEAKLNDINAEIWRTSYDRFQGSGTEIQVRAADAPDTLFLVEGQSTLNSIPANRPIFLIGDRQGANSILKLLPFIERNIQLVALVDASTDSSTWSANTSGSTTNVGVLLNYFQANNPNVQSPSNSANGCDATIRCYEFNANNGGDVELGQWIQSDIVAKVDIALNKQLQPPSPIAVRSPIPPAWNLIPGQLKHVSVGSDGDVWGVNNEDFVFRWNSSSWNNINGRLKQISVGNAQNIWGVDAQDNVFRWDGNDWVGVPGLLKSIAVGSDGAVWGVNSEGFIFQWNGSNWTSVDGSLTQISVGNSQGILGVNSENRVFQWNGGGWNLIGEGFKHATIAADGTILSLAPNNRLHRWNGSSWIAVEGNFMQVSAGNAQEIWAVNAQGEIYRKN